MAAAAGLVREAGYRVVGSDKDLYPPMSTMLEELAIKVHTPYGPENLTREKPDQVVIANALSRGHDELEFALEQNLTTTSFPALLGELFLKDKGSIVVTGTHGKTTTTSLVSHVLFELKKDPSFLIGGIPKNFTRSFRLGKGALFAIEGDEYDTAYFDKGPKFLHYHPKFLIVNNIEFDHADIYENLDAIKKRFVQVMKLVENPENIIANGCDENVLDCLKTAGVLDKALLVGVADNSHGKACRVRLQDLNTENKCGWQGTFTTTQWGNISLQTNLTGYHNMANIAHVLGLLDRLVAAGAIEKPAPSALQDAFASFLGVARRLDFLGEKGGVDVYEDFAHHPTAVGKVIEGFRKSSPEKRLLVAFEPKNATSRRNIFLEAYASAFQKADRAYIGPCPQDQRISQDNRMDTDSLAKAIGGHAASFSDNKRLLEAVVQDAARGDAVIFMSSGSFSGVQHEILEKLGEKFSC